LDGTLHWGEYRRLFLETLVRHMITHVLDSHMQSTGDHADMIASMMVSASSAYDAMLRERKAHSVQMHKGRLGVVFDYSELDLSKNMRTKDMSDDEYDVEFDESGGGEELDEHAIQALLDGIYDADASEEEDAIAQFDDFEAEVLAAPTAAELDGIYEQGGSY
jgi:hypothetical protein